MAQPIGPTPVLTGREATRFLTKISTEEGNHVGPTPTPKLAKVQELIREHGERKQKHVR